MQSEETILQELDTFFRYFALYSKSILDFIGKYVNPYLVKILDIFKQISAALPDNDISYIVILILFLALGIILNRFFEEEE